MSQKKIIRKPIRQPIYQLAVKRSQAGLGLYAAEPIPRNKFIIEYIGEIIDDATADRRGGKYMFEVAKNINVDGTTRENTARYINHSCRPNCEIYYYKQRVFVRSKRNIKAGEELNYDYGDEYFNGFITKRRCRCVKCTAERSAKRKIRK